MSQNILILVHQETSTPGLVGQLLQERGYQLDIRRPCMGEALPSTMDEHDGAIIFGGPMSANDDETLPFIRTELDWISVALESQKPYLGICLGAQMLARALGATVAPHPDERVEIGYFPLMPTSNGQSLFSAPMHVYHWHREGFELPQGAELLATGDCFKHQAFRYGDSAYGLQFHPEMTQDMLNLWTTTGAEHLDRPGAQSRDEQLQKFPLHSPVIQRWLENFLEHWLRHPSSNQPEPDLTHPMDAHLISYGHKR